MISNSENYYKLLNFLVNEGYSFVSNLTTFLSDITGNDTTKIRIRLLNTFM